MSESVNKGIASNPIIHKLASAKGGRVRVPKGLALQPPERRKEIASMGGKAKYANRNSRSDTSTEEQQADNTVQTT